MQDTDKTGNILIIDDNEDLLKAAKMYLKRHLKHVDVEKNPEAIPALLKNGQYDAILLDMNFTKDVSSGHEGFLWLETILDIDPAAVVVLITAYGDVQMAVKAIKAGATDFVLKPWENEKLLATIFAAMRLRESKLEIANLRNRQQLLSADADNKFQDIIGKSPAMQQVFSTIERVAGTDANVLILGENGTGKEVVARAIHRHSARSGEAFIGVDMGAISENLFESELFGHVKGAFTDAREDRPGRFEIADKGTLFLDEIGNLSAPLQAKLLSALQNRQITRVGSNKAKPVDIRLICATNMPLPTMVNDNAFRQDLLYRINTIEIQMPPLRSRHEDIPLLAHHFMDIYNRKYHKNIKSIGSAAMRALQKYNWPGNVRELQHALERAVIMCTDETLKTEDFFFNSSRGTSDENVLLEDYHLEEVEKILIRKAMHKHDGNITRAADELGLTRSSLYRRLEKYGL